eukprot:jgi/Chlat1/6035/Chrsp4S06323
MGFKREFTGFRVAIMGGTGGIGLEVARRFAERGADHIVLAGKDKDHLTKACHEKVFKGKAKPMVVDFMDMEGAEKALKEVPKLLGGGIDVLINAAGGYVPGAAGPKGLLPTMQLNLMSAYMACEGLREALKESEHGGVIINVADAVGTKVVMPSIHTNYTVANAAVLKLTETLALTYAPEVRVNCVSPGYTEGTAMLKVLSGDDEEKEETLKAKRAKVTPLQRLAEPEEVAEAILYVAGQQYATGQNLVLDGGAGLTNWYNQQDQLQV